MGSTTFYFSGVYPIFFRPTPKLAHRKLYWIGTTAGFAWLFITFPITLMLKGDMPEGLSSKKFFSLNLIVQGSTQGRICCLLEDNSTDADLFKRNIWSLAMCFVYFTYNTYFKRRINKYVRGQCPNMRLSCIGKYARNMLSYKVGGSNCKT